MNDSHTFLDLALLLSPLGIQSVTNQADDAQEFLKKWYGHKSYHDANQALKETILQIQKAKICIIGYPCDNGAGLERGSKFGPLALRKHLLKSSPKILNNWASMGIYDIGDIYDHPLLVHDSMYADWVLNDVRKSRWGTKDNALPVSPLSALKKVLEIIQTNCPNTRCLILGGDHSLSFVPVEVLSQNQTIGVLHFDAHTDLLKVRQGLPFSYATWASRANESIGKQQRLIQVGIRQTIKPKELWEKEENVQQLWASEIIANENQSLLNLSKMLDRLDTKNIYLSFDIDVYSEEQVKATGTSSKEGLNWPFIKKALEVVKDKASVIGADLVEVAPGLTRQDPEEPKKTLDIATKTFNKILELLTL